LAYCILRDNLLTGVRAWEANTANYPSNVKNFMLPQGI